MFVFWFQVDEALWKCPVNSHKWNCSEIIICCRINQGIKLCSITIQLLLTSDQCFVDFGKVCVQSFHLPWHSSVNKSWSEFVSAHIEEARTLCLMTIQLVFGFDWCFLDFGEGFVVSWFHLPRCSSFDKSCPYFVEANIKEARTLYFIAIYLVFALDWCLLDFGEGFMVSWFHLPWKSSFRKSCSDFVLTYIKEATTLCFITIHLVFTFDWCFLDFGEGFRG